MEKINIIILSPPEEGRLLWKQDNLTLDTSRRIQIIDEGLIVPTVERGDQFAERAWLFSRYNVVRDLATARSRQRTVKMIGISSDG
jgi:hypothetical protein